MPGNLNDNSYFEELKGEKANKIREILKSWNLCICEKVILIYLLCFSEKNTIKISRSKISKDLGISNLTLGRYLKYLTDKKLIFKKRIRKCGRFSANEYSFSEEERSD